MPLNSRLLRPRRKRSSASPIPTNGLMLWLDGADDSTLFQNIGGTTPVTANGQPVLRWNDKSGNGRNALATRVLSTLTLTNGGTGYTTAPDVTITRHPTGDSTGTGATATATVSGGVVTALTITNRGNYYQTDPVVSFSGGGGSGAAASPIVTVNATRQTSPPGVLFNNGSLSIPRGPYMELPATTIPQSYTVFGVYTRIAAASGSLPSVTISTGYSTPTEASPQGSRYASFWANDNLLYNTSTAVQSQFTTHRPQRGFHNEVTIVKTVRTAGTSVLVQVNDMPASTVTTGAGVTNAASGAWSSVGSDVTLQGSPSLQVLRPHRGPIHELIVYDRVLTQAEQTAVTAYMRAKWSVIWGSEQTLTWPTVGVSAWPGYRWSIANTTTTATVADTLTTPTGTYPGTTAFYGGVLLTDGRVFCVPHSSTTARIYNPANDSLSTPAGTHPGTNAFAGGVLLQNGRVFCVPHNSTTARIYDPTTDTLTTPTGTYPGTNAFWGGVLLPDGRVFCVPHNSTTARIYNPTTDALTTPTGTYPGSSAFAGGVLLPDGRVFCVPHNSTTARIYDPTTDTLTTPTGTYPGTNAFAGGVLLPDGRVFCVPINSSTARIYSPANDVLTTAVGTYPGAGTDAFIGGVLLPDGRVLCVPRSSTTARIYNPATDTLTTPTGTYPGSSAFAGGVLLTDGRAFCVPASNASASIYGGGTGFNINVVLSAYFNKL